MLTETGLRETDPRLKECMENFENLNTAEFDHDLSESAGVYIDKNTFRECIADNIELIAKAFSNSMVVPEFSEFKKEIDILYRKAKCNKNGKVSIGSYV
ncbi:hypothetical protein KUTeg_000215 [Tegillarca granosa]|uniref:Glutaminase EF-hand domain-containing protein n=1 Tax=Tegillarca granosa TaxID=220873 RepID=A0ABQ9FWX3_TEGGR|nr:hypothetical protein KUTeg_000215 [Tegillarca granosa]